MQASGRQAVARARHAGAARTRVASSWLADPKTIRAMKERWNDIHVNGSDADAIRLIEKQMDRAYGRPGEQKPEPEIELPKSIAEVRAMTREQRCALPRELEKREAAN